MATPNGRKKGRWQRKGEILEIWHELLLPDFCPSTHASTYQTLLPFQATGKCSTRGENILPSLDCKGGRHRVKGPCIAADEKLLCRGTTLRPVPYPLDKTCQKIFLSLDCKGAAHKVWAPCMAADEKSLRRGTTPHPITYPCVRKAQHMGNKAFLLRIVRAQDTGFGVPVWQRMKNWFVAATRPTLLRTPLSEKLKTWRKNLPFFKTVKAQDTGFRVRVWLRMKNCFVAAPPSALYRTPWTRHVKKSSFL